MKASDTPPPDDDATPDTPTPDTAADEAREMRLTAAGMLAMGLQFGVMVAAGFYAGRWLDAKLETRPWLMISLVVTGVCITFRDLIKMAHRAMRDQDED